jgi:hypothetical protein
VVINLSSDIVRYLEKHGVFLDADQHMELKRELVPERMSRNHEEDTRAAWQVAD